MKPKKRQKMCYNCEGEVDLDVIVCPFCAADLRAEKPEQQRPTYNHSTSMKNINTQQSLYPPHYAPKTTAVVEEEEESPSVEEEPQGMEPQEEEESKSVLGPTILLTLGSQLLLFGIFMFLFSQKGVFILKWDARMWFLYLLASVPLLIFGYRNLK